MTFSSSPGGISFLRGAGGGVWVIDPGVVVGRFVGVASGSVCVWHAEAASTPTAVMRTRPNLGQIRSRIVVFLGDEGSDRDQFLDSRPAATRSMMMDDGARTGVAARPGPTHVGRPSRRKMG